MRYEGGPVYKKYRHCIANIIHVFSMFCVSVVSYSSPQIQVLCLICILKIFFRIRLYVIWSCLKISVCRGVQAPSL